MHIDANPIFLSWDTGDLPGDAPTSAYRVSLWHLGECHMCGSEGETVVDHDHETHMTRGMLCRSCNTREGVGHDGPYAAWREGRNPGQMYGLAEEYWTAFTWGEHLPEPSDDIMRRGAEAAGRIG